MGCAIVHFQDKSTRDAILKNLGEEFTLKGVKVSLMPNVDKNTKEEDPKAIFLAWTRRDKSLTPSLKDAIKTCFDEAVVQRLYEKTFNQVVSHIKTLSLIGVNWDGAEVRKFAETLCFCNELECLELDGNPCGDEGGTVVAEVMKLCPNLLYLSMTDCSLGDESAIAFAAAIPQCSSLVCLRIVQNGYISEAGIRACEQAWADSEKPTRQHWSFTNLK